MYELDRQIIRILQSDGRASNAKIAREVGVSEGTVRRRLRHLVQEDVIKVIAVPNLEQMGYGTAALIGIADGPRNDRRGCRQPSARWTRPITSPSPPEPTISSPGSAWSPPRSWEPS